MHKTLVALVATLTLTLAHAVPARADTNLTPAVVLTTCAGVYGTLAVFASPQNQPALKARAVQIMNVALTLNPNASAVAIKLMEKNVTRIRANDPTVVDEIKGAEEYCRGYLPRYGL